MKKIKIFGFEVSNSASHPLSKDENESWFAPQQKKLCKENDMERIINAFSEDKNVIDISVNTVDVNYHNNGRGNTIRLVYTIVYEE